MLSVGGGVVVPVDDFAFIVAPKFLIGSVDDASARGMRGSLYVVGAALFGSAATESAGSDNWVGFTVTYRLTIRPIGSKRASCDLWIGSSRAP